MSRAEFIQLVWQMRNYQKEGNRDLAEKAEKRVDDYLSENFEQKLFNKEDYE